MPSGPALAGKPSPEPPLSPPLTSISQDPARCRTSLYSRQF